MLIRMPTDKEIRGAWPGVYGCMAAHNFCKVDSGDFFRLGVKELLLSNKVEIDVEKLAEKYSGLYLANKVNLVSTAIELAIREAIGEDQ